MTQDKNNHELYKTFVETITAAEQRRQQASAVYLSLISAGAAALGIANDLDQIYVVIPAMVVSIIWFSSIQYFRGLAEAKFKVIEKLEATWVIKPFKQEWEEFEKLKKKNPMLRVKLTQLETIPPIIIIISSTLYITYRLLSLIC